MRTLAKALLESGHADFGRHGVKLRFGKTMNDVMMAVAKARMAGADRQLTELSAALEKLVKQKRMT